MQLVRRGHAAAFEVVYDRHAGAAFSLAYRMCGQRALAEDVVQEGFLALWRSGSRYDTQPRERARLDPAHRPQPRDRRAAARSRPRQRADRRRGDRRARGRRRERTDLEFVRRDEAREIRDALDGLPDEQSRVIELAYFGGLTHVEIASMLDVPVGTIKGRMRLGLAKMRMALGDPAEVVQ